MDEKKEKSEIMVEVKHVSMKFRMANDKIQSLKEYAIAIAKKKLKYRDFWVFEDLDFEVKKGEVVGIIGRNGAGKSTLLKIISGVLSPTKGEVKAFGNIVPMLELGSGFDMELSGRENIFLNGSILGYSEAFIKEKYKEILEFSGLEEFIEIPIRNYSSGMLMRLAFSIATMVQPEILIVDEILAVGDEAFQKKSKRKMLELMGGGTTVLFVSHSMDQIREMCNKVIWLESGKLRMSGETKAVCDAYQEYINPSQSEESFLKSRRNKEAEKYYMDVLFIYEPDGEAYYGRLAHQKEQLIAGNLCSSEICVTDLSDNLIKKYRVFILVQCQMSKELVQFVKNTFENGKVILADLSYGNNKEEIRMDVWELLKAIKMYCKGVIISNESIKEYVQSLGYAVYLQPDTVNDRIEQIAEWAIYDREILPFQNPQDLEEQELINYQKAVFEKTKHEEDGIRIGWFSKTGTQENILDRLLKSDSKIVLWTREGLAQSRLKKKYPEKVKNVSYKTKEDWIRVLANLDIVVGFFDKDNQIDVLWEEWLLTSLVKVPYMLITHKKEGLLFPEKGIGITEEDFWEKIMICLKEPKNCIKWAKANHERVKKRYTTLNCAKDYSFFIRKEMNPNMGIYITDIKYNSESSFFFYWAYKMRKRGIDVFFLTDGQNVEGIKVAEDEIPVLSKTEIYIYGSFDSIIAGDWKAYSYLQNYPNIKHRYYWIQGFSPEQYHSGDFSRFSSIQTYHPCVPITYLTPSKSCKKWLTEDYNQICELLFPFWPQKKKRERENDAQEKVKVLIEGSCYYQDLELYETFEIVKKLDKDRFEIWYLFSDQEVKESYLIDRLCEPTSCEEIMEIYETCDILLQGVRRERYESAIQLMEWTDGTCVVVGEDYEEGEIQQAFKRLNEIGKKGGSDGTA